MRATDLQVLITATITPQASIDAMLTDLGAALNGAGALTRTLLHSPEHPNPQLMSALLLHLRQQPGQRAIININAKDELVVGERDGRPLTVHDAWDIPLIALMVDHPACHMQHLHHAPHNAVLTVIDRTHLTFLAEAKLSPRQHVFCPHGGPPIVQDPRPMAQRSIPLLFVGNISQQPAWPEWLDRVAGQTLVKRAAITSAYEAALAGMPLYEALKQGFAAKGLFPTPLALSPLIIALDTYISQTRRLDCLAAITSQPVDIYGEVDSPAAARLGHHRLHGPVSYAQALSLMADARLVLNSRCTFAHGGHERIFYAMSRGAAVITDPSHFLADDLSQGLGMAAWPAARQDVDQMIMDSLKTVQSLQDRGLGVYEQRHSWRARLSTLLHGLDLLKAPQ